MKTIVKEVYDKQGNVVERITETTTEESKLDKWVGQDTSAYTYTVKPIWVYDERTDGTFVKW